MSTAWVAGSVRASAMARRRLGAAGARALAASDSLPSALATLATTPYGHDIRAGQALPQAQRAVAATLLWNLRVLAGWLPRDGADVVRLLAGWFEIANTDEHVRALGGAPAEPPFRLGTLGTAWDRLETTTSASEVRRVLSASVWRDPGGETPHLLAVGMRLSWASRVASRVPAAAPWAAGAAALLLARETILYRRWLPEALDAQAVAALGPGVVGVRSLPDLRSALPGRARWALEAVPEPAALWTAEARWWHRVERDGFVLLRSSRFEAAPVVGAAAVLAVDAWRVGAALEVAARGGTSMEAFDEVG